MTGILLAVFLGWAGGYRFYKGNIGVGILYLFTFGFFGIGWIIDIASAYTEYKRDQRGPAPVVSQTSTSSSPSSPTEPTFWVHYSKDTEKNINQIKTDFIVIDTETTGVNSKYDRMVSIAAIEYRNGIPYKDFYTLVNPGMSIPQSATKINGITNEMVRTAPSEHDVCTALLSFLGDAVFGKTLLVAYNAPFDAGIIKNAMERYQLHGNIRIFDALPYSRQKLKGLLPDYKQTTVADYLGIDTSNAHNSKRDCEICASILLNLVKNF